MNLLIDTNIALYFLAGDDKLASLLDNSVVHLSFISELELLSYPDLNKKEKSTITDFVDDCVIIDINNRIKKETIRIRQNAALKVPDAIIAATAISEQLPFLSADKDFERVEGLHLFSYEL